MDVSRLQRSKIRGEESKQIIGSRKEQQKNLKRREEETYQEEHKVSISLQLIFFDFKFHVQVPSRLALLLIQLHEALVEQKTGICTGGSLHKIRATSHMLLCNYNNCRSQLQPYYVQQEVDRKNIHNSCMQQNICNFELLS